MRSNKAREIVLAAAKLFSKKGYNGTSFDEIADMVGLHKSSIFHYFKNKEELLLQVLGTSINEVSVNLENIVSDEGLEPEEKLKRAIGNHITLLIKYSHNVNVYFNDLRNLSKRNQSMYLGKREKYETTFENILAEMQAKGFFKNLDVSVVSKGLLAMLNWVNKWYREDGLYDLREISDMYYRLITGRAS